jgi:hypothetical protein
VHERISGRPRDAVFKCLSDPTVPLSVWIVRITAARPCTRLPRTEESAVIRICQLSAPRAILLLIRFPPLRAHTKIVDGVVGRKVHITFVAFALLIDEVQIVREVRS